MSLTANPLIEAYLLRVGSALADLEPTERYLLLADLRLHLEEVEDDSGRSLDDVVGAPEAYAAELRRAVGLTPPDMTLAPMPTVVSDASSAALPWLKARVHEAWEPVRSGAGEIALAVREARTDGPWWWLLHGYLALHMLSALTGGTSGTLWPSVLGSRLLTIPCLYVALLLSVRVGRDPDLAPQRVVRFVNLLVVVIGGLHFLVG